MEQLSGLLRRLQQVLREPQPRTPGMKQVTVSALLSPADALDPSLGLLSWLATQPAYPQFYWQHRQMPEEAAVCGLVRGFAHIEDAEHFLHQHGCSPQVRIWGLNAFDQARHCDDNRSAGYLFLPRVEVLCQDNQLSLTVNLFSEQSLQDDAEEAAAFVKFLLPAQPIPPLNTIIVAEQHQPTRDGWIAMIEQALRHIAATDLEKVVLARCTTLTLTRPLRPASMMAASRNANYRCYHFMLVHDAQQAFMGSSPERLYARRDNALSTEALAGTVVSDDDDTQAAALAQWLMNDAKNQCENRLVVEDICQRLHRVAATLDVTPPEVVRLRKVQHLRRGIQATLTRCSDVACLADLQPTAAVAGLPRETARQFIRDVEPFARGWYAGSAGYLARQRAEFCVALRSAEIHGETVKLYAGAGILPGSDPAQEWVELENKAAGLKSLLDGKVS